MLLSSFERQTNLNTEVNDKTKKKEFYILVGERIKAAREEHSFTQDELAIALRDKSISVSPVTISRWESAERNPGLSEINAISEILGKPLLYFTNQDLEEKKEDDLDLLLRRAKALSEDDRQDIIEYAEYRYIKHKRSK